MLILRLLMFYIHLSFEFGVFTVSFDLTTLDRQPISTAELYEYNEDVYTKLLT